MDIRDIVIVIPMYKVNLEWYEELSLKRAVEVFANYHICVCCPNSLDLSPIEEKCGIKNIERFDDGYFNGIEGYNHLMMSDGFYERFLNFRYMLIYQLDAFVFVDRLQYFCNLGYDYIGAPWTQPAGIFEFRGRLYRLRVGNGGLSLRKVKACYEILKKCKDVVGEWHQNEDSFFSYCGYSFPMEFCVAPFKVAKEFSFEASVRRLYKKNNNNLPLGCHAWLKFGGNIYPLLFKQIGIDLEDYKSLLGNEDFTYEVSRFWHRLHSRIIQKSSFSGILPYRKCWSIVGFGKIGKALAELFLEKNIRVNNLYDSGFSDSNGEWNNIKLIKLDDIRCLEKEKGMVVISTLTYEKELIEMFEGNGWIYGQDFVSLCREYARRFKHMGYEKYLYADLE